MFRHIAPINSFDYDVVIKICGVIRCDVVVSSSMHVTTSGMTQRVRNKRLSLPSTYQYTQPLSHCINCNARTRRLWRHKPLLLATINLPRGEWVEWCRAICSWCFIGWAWVAHSDYSRNGDYKCNKDNWLTSCVNWRSTEIQSVLRAKLRERLSVSLTGTATYWDSS